MNKVNIKLDNVQETLLLPLWGRAQESGKANPRLIDNKAVEIIDSIDYDFSTIAKNTIWLTQLTWVARSIHVDKMIQDYIKGHPYAVIVNIGCGLDTTFERINAPNIKFFDVDLPDVIALRAKLFQDNVNRKTISSSFLETKWLSELGTDEDILFIAAGLFYYFDEVSIRKFFINLADQFRSCDLFFDAMSPLGLKISNKRVIKNTGMSKSAELKWGIKNIKDIEKWDKRIKVVKLLKVFKGFKKGYPFKMKYGLFMSDFLSIISMVHLRIEN